MKKDNVREQEKALKRVSKILTPKGLECGREIAGLLKKKCNITIPLYRSAIVITPNKNGSALLETYHDPHYMGRKLNRRTLKGFNCNKLVFVGQRDGVQIFKEQKITGKVFEISEYNEKAQKEILKIWKGQRKE